MKKILSLLLLATSSVFSMQLDVVKVQEMQQRISNQGNFSDVQKVKINPKVVCVPGKIGDLELFHGKKGFSIIQDDVKHKIQPCFTDPLVRNINREKLEAFLQSGYLSINKMNDGEFSLKAKGRLLGAGPIGAMIGCWVGKATVYVIGHGVIGLVAAASGPAAPVTFLALEAWFAPAIEVSSNAGAVGGAILGGIATGPV